MSCPVCKKKTSTTYRPFCSIRCADLDLGKWLTGGYAIPAAETDDDDSIPVAFRPENPKLH